jgi:ABC-type antimicrobial peptide transport system permease subunit
MLGTTLVEKLFDGQSPIGKSLRIQNVPLRVIGVLRSKGANIVGMDQDDIILMPWTTLKFRISGGALGQVNQSSGKTTGEGLGQVGGLYPRLRIDHYPSQTASQIENFPRPQRSVKVDTIMVQAISTDAIPQAIEELKIILRETHHLAPNEANDFNVLDFGEMTKMFKGMTTAMTSLLLAISAISLIVGGVGIMNIMLVSVTERTREIGLRMAVGAKPADILRQFLTESIILCIAGGVLGIVFGRCISFTIASLLRWPTDASPSAIIVAVSVSMVIGVAFGFYPAYLASKLSPIDALRYE